MPHPFLTTAISLTLNILVPAFLRPKHPLRLILFPPLYWTTLDALPQCLNVAVRTPWAALLGGVLVTSLFNYIDVALVSRWSFDADGPIDGSVGKGPAEAEVRKPEKKRDSGKEESGESRKGGSMWARINFGIRLAMNQRMVHTPYQVANIRPPSTLRFRTFVLRKIATIAVCYIALDTLSSISDPSIGRTFLVVEKVPLISRWSKISAEEVAIRVFSVLFAGIGLNCVQGGIYNIVALFSVGSHLSSPKDWPPFYGSPTQAYTLTMFWGIYWHQMNTRKLSVMANFVIHQVLRLPRGNALSRAARLVVAFTVSGALHVLLDISAGIPVRASGAMRFFMMQALGILVERMLSSLLRRDGKEGIPPGLSKPIGFVWVVLWLVWTAPGYLYPIMWRANSGVNDSVVPYSLFNLWRK